MEQYPEDWKTRRRLTVRRAGMQMTLGGNGDSFATLADSCARLAEYGDDVACNKYPPHMHHDMDDVNTSKSMGVTFYYWHHGGGTSEMVSD